MPVLLPRGGGQGRNGHGCAKAATVDVLADMAMVDGTVPLLPSSPCLLPHLLDNYATVFVIVVVGPFRQRGAGGKKQTLLPMPPPLPMGGRDTLEIKEFRNCRPDCNVYVDRAAHDGSTNVQGQRQGGSPVDDDDDDNGGGDDYNGGPAEMPDGVGDKFEAPLERDEAKFGF